MAAVLLASCASTPPTTAAGPETPVDSTLAPVTLPPEVTTATGPGGPAELRRGSDPLAPGTYRPPGFRPPLTFAIESDGWVVGTLGDGFFDIQQDPGAPDVIAVQFGLVLAVAGAGELLEEVDTAAAALAAIKANPRLVVVGESESRLGGLRGFTVEVDNVETTNAPVLRVSAGVLGFDPGRSLWISLLDSPDGVVAVIVGSTTAERDLALSVAEPVLESVLFEGP
jgi:hypothetical protein